MERKSYVLDTNVLLFDPDSFKTLGRGNEVIIPMVVLEELDKKKKGRDSISPIARKVVRDLDKLQMESPYSLYTGIPLEEGGVLRVIYEVPDTSSSPFIENGYGDNIIINMILHEMERTGANLTLVSKDFNLRVKASALGIDVEDYNDSVVEDKNIYDPTHEKVWMYQTDIDMLFRNGRVDLHELGHDIGNENVVDGKKQMPHGYWLATSFTDSNTKALAKYDGKGVVRVVPPNISAYGLKPRNLEQRFALDALLDSDVHLVILTGVAGTGKSLLALAAGFELVEVRKKHEKISVSRPPVDMGNDYGYLPGSLREKMDPWMAPIYDNLSVLVKSKKDTPKEIFEQYENDKMIYIEPLNVIRGRSIANTYIIVDEAQNLTWLEIKTIITRAGINSKVVLTGDPTQIDAPYLDQYSNGLAHAIEKLTGEPIFQHVHLNDSVRSELAKLVSEKL